GSKSCRKGYTIVGVQGNSFGLSPAQPLSLDRWQVPRKDTQTSNGQCLSRRVLRRTASDGASCSRSPSHFAEAQGTVAAALSLEDTREFLPSEQRPPEDPKKDKVPKQAQQSWLKVVLNFLLLRTGLEEPREKASRKSKGKEEPTEVTEAAEEPAPRKKAQEKKTSRKKHNHRKPGAEEPKRTQDPDAKDQEDLLPSLTAALQAEEVDLEPARRGGLDSDFLQSLPMERCCAGISDSSPGLSSEDILQKPDQEEVIRRIVELLKKAGDQWEEEEVQIPQPEEAVQNPAPPARKKSQEKKPSLKKLSLKKPASEEPGRAGADVALSPEPRPRRPGFLPLCVSSHWTSTSSSHATLEEPRVHEALSTDGGVSHPSELPTPAGFQGPPEELLLDKASESSQYPTPQTHLMTLDGEAQPQVQEAVEKLTPACKKKKPNLRRAFSHKKHSSKESKKTEAAGLSGAASSEARPPKRHGFLPMCVGGHRASVSSGSESLEFQEPQAAGGRPAGLSEAQPQSRSHTLDEGPPLEGDCESKEFIIHSLVALLQEVDGELGSQIQRRPSFKKFFYQFSDTSLRKLVATLHSQRACLLAEDRSLASRPSPCAFGSLNKFAANHSCAICTLMQSRGNYRGHSYAHFLSRKAQQVREREGKMHHHGARGSRS
uniref:BCL2 interacting protein 5 n=1 Tax=Nannospalax galili TaxID=1026970 RepID=A0A8C6W9M2_NANGA